MLPELEAALSTQPRDQRDESLACNAMGDHADRLCSMGEDRLTMRDLRATDVSVLGLTPPGVAGRRAEYAPPLSQAANDLAAESVRNKPARFRCMSTTPMATSRAVPAELERAATERATP